jgi:hypothetical protein
MAFEPALWLAATDIRRPGSKDEALYASGFTSLSPEFCRRQDKDEEYAMRSLTTTSVLIASMVLSASAGIAAPLHPSPRTVARAHPAAHIVPRPGNQLNADIGQFIQSMLGGGFPVQYSRLVQDAMRAPASRRSSGSYDWSPSYDNSPGISASSAASDAQAASDAENQAIQSMNDTNAMTASNAAAQAANDAANAATLQSEINANN